jgi:hypothetical protein
MQPESKRLSSKENFTRHYRKIDYEEFSDALKKGECMVLYAPLKRQTVWKAAKKLTVMVGRKVIAVAGEEKQGRKKPQKCYLFMIDESGSPRLDELAKRESQQKNESD